MWLFIKNTFINRFFVIIIKWHNENEKKFLIVYVIMCMLIFIFLLYNNFVTLLPRPVLLLTNLFCVAVMFFVINYFREKANNNRIVTEYDQLLKYVQKYEKLVESKSKNQHEYKKDRKSVV